MKRIILVITILAFTALTSYAFFPNLKALDQIKLSDQQKEQIKKIMVENQKSMIDLKANLDKAELDLRNLISSKDVVKDEVLKANDKVADIEKQIKVSRINVFFTVRDVLSIEQREEFRTLIDKAPGCGAGGHEDDGDMPMMGGKKCPGHAPMGEGNDEGMHKNCPMKK